MKKRWLVMACVGLLGACANTSPKTSIAALEAALTAGETAAAAYVGLPACEAANHPPLCSDLAVVLKIRLADNVAFAAVRTAEQISQDVSASPSKVQAALTAASDALTALEGALTTTQGGAKP